MIFSCKNKEKKLGQTVLAVEVVKPLLLGELRDNPKQRASYYPKLLISCLSPYLVSYLSFDVVQRYANQSSRRLKFRLILRVCLIIQAKIMTSGSGEIGNTPVNN